VKNNSRTQEEYRYLQRESSWKVGAWEGRLFHLIACKLPVLIAGANRRGAVNLDR
jgi:hypothetical protein